MSDFINTVDVIGDEALVSSIVDRTIKEIADNTIQTMRNYAFSYCDKLESVDLPACETISSDCFAYCTNLVHVNLPLATSATYQAFQGCQNLKTLRLPSATSMGSNAFSNCYKLKRTDFSLNISIMNSFSGCHSLIALILRSESLCVMGGDRLSSCSHFTGTVNATYNPDGLKDGYIYVPRALVEQYKVATNWSVYASQFRALEDYTVDGTIHGKLDESKI